MCFSLHVGIFLGIAQLLILALTWSQRCNIRCETTRVGVLLILGLDISKVQEFRQLYTSKPFRPLTHGQDQNSRLYY